MELSQLAYFLSVAEARSFRHGADRAHISPPAVTKAIQRLEEELGARLFSRTTRRVTLTPAGERLAVHCRAVFDRLARAREEIDESKATVTGELRVGAMEVFSILLLPAAISRLVQAHPLVTPRCHELVPQEMERLLLDGRLDVAFTIGAGGVRGVRYRSIGRSPGVLVCGRGHALFRRGRVDAGDLLRHAFVVPQFLGREHLPALDQFPEQRHPRRVGATIELLQMGVQLTVEGSYLGFFPEICVRQQLARGQLRALKGIEGAQFELQALTRADAPPRRAARLLIEQVQQVIGAR
jgi:DNA-binding transcriptional LysR family regulator